MSHLKPNLPRSWYSLPKKEWRKTRMSKEKQIDEKHELSESIYMSGHGLDRKDSDDIAEQLYHEGYRKQSEGKWIFAGDGIIQCTSCDEVYEARVLPRNFCPNCGAKLKGV